MSTISSAMRMARWPVTAAERFWSRVNKNGPVARPELGPCWVWTGTTTKRRLGYGNFHVDGRLVLAHRWAWEQQHGPLRSGQRLLHRCDVSTCVCVEHMAIGTQAANMQDCVVKGRGGHQKLSVDDVRVIRARIADGETRSSIAIDFGVSRITIVDIATGRTWSHL